MLSHTAVSRALAVVGALTLGVLAAALRYDETGAGGWLRVAGLAAGFALMTHHYVTLLVILPAEPPPGVVEGPAEASWTLVDGAAGLDGH